MMGWNRMSPVRNPLAPGLHPFGGGTCGTVPIGQGKSRGRYASGLPLRDQSRRTRMKLESPWGRVIVVSIEKPVALPRSETWGLENSSWSSTSTE